MARRRSGVAEPARRNRAGVESLSTAARTASQIAGTCCHSSIETGGGSLRNTVGSEARYYLTATCHTIQPDRAITAQAFPRWPRRIGTLEGVAASAPAVGPTHSGRSLEQVLARAIGNILLSMCSSTHANAMAVYGTQGVPAASNTPGARNAAVAWVVGLRGPPSPMNRGSMVPTVSLRPRTCRARAVASLLGRTPLATCGCSRARDTTLPAPRTP